MKMQPNLPLVWQSLFSVLLATVVLSGCGGSSGSSTTSSNGSGSSAYTLVGSTVTLVEYGPDTAIAATQPATAIVGQQATTFSSTNLFDLNNVSIAGSNLIVGKNTIAINYDMNTTANTGLFNGPVFTFANGAPTILGCSLDPSSTYTTAQVTITCSANKVFVNASGITITPTSKILVDLNLGAPSAPSYSLIGSTIELVEYDPNTSTPVTQPAIAVVGEQKNTFSSVNLFDLNNASVAGSNLIVGGNTITIDYTATTIASVGTFNGPVFFLAAGSPTILGCQLDPTSSYTTSQVIVSCTSNQVLVNASGISITPTSKILVNLQLGAPG